MTIARTAHSLLARLAAGAALAPLSGAMIPAAWAQTPERAAISLPAMPLDAALRTIAARSGTRIEFDPDAVAGLSSAPVDNAASAQAAVRAAIRDRRLAVSHDGDALVVTGDIVVIARRDPAETDLLVRDATTSSRTGQSLREQPRNSQVISARLIAEQQAQTLADALRNAGGVSVNTATVQGGVAYTVRGFGSSGITNGLPTVVAQGLSAGATQPLANVERIEVLKGPDAVLAGVNNLGGTINIVTKKPSAAPVLDLTGETGSFGQWRLTGDANGALNADRTVSARLIVSTNNADRNFGGYRGNMDNLVAPSIRYKDAATDVILNATLGDQSFGMPPFTLLDPGTNRPFAQPRDRPFLGVKDQGIRIETTQFFGEASRSVADWLTLTLRGQHQETDVTIRQYSPFVVFAPDGTGLISATHSRLTGVHSRTRLAALVEAWL